MAVTGGNEIARIFVRLALDSAEYTKGLTDVEKKTNTWAGSITGMAKTTGKAIAGVAVAGFTAMGAAIVTSTKKAIDLEAQLSDIAAVTGANVGQIDSLNNLIKDLGIDPKLKVSAAEAADAIEMLGRNGLTVQEIMDGAARSTVLLSNATGGDFALSADIATDTMALFGIEAANMEKAVDGITSVVNNSKFSIEDYRFALAMGGGVAASVGVEFEDFNTTVAAIAPLFSGGSDAGTSFKVFLQRLVPHGSKAADALAELGIITADGTNRFFDAEGQLKSMAEISGILAESTMGLSEEQKNLAFSTAFGTDAMRAAFGLANIGEQEFRTLQATMGDTSAAEAAAIRMDNLAGSLEILSGVVETIQLAIGEKFIPILRGIVDWASIFLGDSGPGIINFFENLAKNIDIFSHFIVSVAQDEGFKKWLVQIPIEAQPFAIFLGDLIWGFKQLYTWIVDLANFAWPILAENMNIILPILGVIGAVILALNAPLIFIGAAIVLLATAWSNNWGGIQEKTQQVLDFLQPYIDRFLKAVSGWWDEHGASVIGIVQGLWNFIQKTWETLVTFWETWNTELMAIAGANWSTVVTIVTTAINQISNIIDLIAALIKGDWETVGRELQEIWSTAWNATVTILGNARTALVNAITILWGMVEPLWTNIVDSIRYNWNAMWNSVVTFFETKKQALVDKLLDIKNTFTNQWQSMVTWISDKWTGLWSGVVDWITTKKNDITSKLLELKNAVASFFTLENFVNLGRNIIDGIIRGIYDKSAQLYNSLKQLASDALTAAKYNLGIRSPSALFASAVGMPISEGIAAGIMSGLPSINKAIGAAITLPDVSSPAGLGGGSVSNVDNRAFTVNNYGTGSKNTGVDLQTMRAFGK